MFLPDNSDDFIVWATELCNQEIGIKNRADYLVELAVLWAEIRPFLLWPLLNLG